MRRHIGSAKTRRVEAMQRDIALEQEATSSAGRRKLKPNGRR